MCHRNFVFGSQWHLFFQCYMQYCNRCILHVLSNIMFQLHHHLFFSPSLLSGRQQEAVQGGGEWPSGWSNSSWPGLEQAQAAEWVHHCCTVPGAVQVYCAVSDMPPQVTDIWDFYVPIAASGLYQQVLAAGEFTKAFTMGWKAFGLLDLTLIWCWGQWKTIFLRNVNVRTADPQ